MTLHADLSGQTALVTGASSGLGRHFAQTLSAAGAEVVLAARREPELRALAAEIGEAARAELVDLTSAEAIRAAVDRIGPIDILVNNAGITHAKPLLDVAIADYDRLMATNVRGTFLMALEVARTMKAAGRGGSIINVASILASRQAKQVTAYAISKAAVVQMTKQFALELASDGIRVNALCPGYIETDLNKDFFATKAGEALVKRVPQRRLGRYEDLDGPLLLLASDASRFMTGSTIVVDGGHLVSSL